MVRAGKMSNFDFLNNAELIREFPAYELIYKYVCKVEKSYYNVSDE